MSAISISFELFAVTLFVVAAFLLALGVYELFIRPLREEAEAQQTGMLVTVKQVGLTRLGELLRRFMWPSYEGGTRRKLTQAGEPGQLKPEELMAMQVLSALFFTLFGFVVLAFFQKSLLFTLVFTGFGIFYPLIWLNDQVSRRHHLITRALPYNLDLLTLSVEAGLDFTGALARVVEKGRSGPLREEFQLVLKQLKMGKTREEVLKALIARVELPALTSFVTALIQADRMGTSLGKVLRIQSTQLRIERTQRAEKLANEAPVKMLFPLVACIFPTVFMILFGPIIYSMMNGGAG